MKINDKLLKPITEAKYLATENSWRYRAILRYFYLQDQKMKYWLYKEEIFAALKADEHFQEYTMDQCKQDLDTLAEWKNIIPLQDTKKAASVEEFKNKQFRYQLSPYTVEIERMTLQLENLVVEGASLELSLIERFKNELGKFNGMMQEDQETVGSWWHALNEDFKRLNQNYQDYIRDLYSIKADEMMKTTAFLVFKDKFMEYLRNFIKGLQQNCYAIEAILNDIDAAVETVVLDQVTAYVESIPRMDTEISKQDIRDNIVGRWNNIKNWFLGDGVRESESARLFDLTGEIIRKITRYAFQIVENRNSAANRKEEYRKVCKLFLESVAIEEAHLLSAQVFGIFHTRHICGNMIRETESINSGVYDELPCEVIIKPRVRHYREKRDRTPLPDHTVQKQQMLKTITERRKGELKIIESYIVDESIDFSRLPQIEPHVRVTLLRWLSRAYQTPHMTAKTESGRVYKIIPPADRRRCILDCTDGQLELPAYIIQFE